MRQTAGLTLPKTLLLKKSSEFQRVYSQGKRSSGSNFTMIVALGAMDFPRLGISVQKKTGNAVRRNRIKRLIREVFRCHRDDFPPASDIVFTVRPGFTLDSAPTLRAAIAELLTQAREGKKRCG